MNMARTDQLTPCPWFVVKHPGDGWTIQDNRNGGGFCVAQKYGDSGIENAHLLAAAPELLNAIKLLLADYAEDCPNVFRASIALSRAAIEKAEVA